MIDLLSLKIKTENFDIVAKKPTLLKKLRHLTLHPRSGMNFELNHLIKSAATRNVNAKVILAYYKRELVGWALLSREKSEFTFPETYDNFNPARGTLFEVYVDPSYRKQGIGAALLKAGRQRAGSMKLCVAPWDYTSTRFYQNFDHYKLIKM